MRRCLPNKETSGFTEQNEREVAMPKRKSAAPLMGALRRFIFNLFKEKMVGDVGLEPTTR